MDDVEAQRRFAAARVARLATVRPDGTPHLVPVTFAVHGGTIFTAVDAKPKRTRHLQRVRNLEADPRCSLLVDHYDDDWTRLWWVRADAVARVIRQPEPSRRGLALLAERYAAYATSRPEGPLIAAEVRRWTGWSAI